MSAMQLGREDEGIQEMLLDAGLDGAEDLRNSLGELRALALEPAPEPRADLAALLAPAVPSLGQRRWSRRRRMAVVGAALAGTMSLGAGAVAAANEDFRRGVSESVSGITQTVGEIFLPPSDVPVQQPAPAAPSPSYVPAVPAPAATAPVPETTAAAPATVAPAAPAAPGSSPVDPGSSPAEPGQGREHAASPPPPGHLPAVPGAGVAPHLPGAPAVPPLPGDLPTHLR
jgi:hypothetical protein